MRKQYLMAFVAIFSFMSGALHAPFSRSHRDTGAIRDIDSVVDSSGNTWSVGMQALSFGGGQYKFFIRKTDASGAVLGSTTWREIRIEDSSSAHTTTRVRIDGFQEIRYELGGPRIAVDSNDDIYLSCAIRVSGTDYVLLIKVDGTNGNLVLSFVKQLTYSWYMLEYLDDIIVDSSDRVLVIMRCDDGAYKFPFVVRVDGASPVDEAVLNAQVEDASNGVTLAVDDSDNVYVAGEDAGDLFCVKVREGDFAVDTAGFATGGVAGVYQSSLGLDDNSVTGVSIYNSSIYVTAIAPDRTFKINRLNMAGVEQETLSTSPLPANSTPKRILQRTSDGYFYIGGTYPDLMHMPARTTPFVLRTTDAGVLDAAFETGIPELADGIKLINPDAGSEVENPGDGGKISHDNITGVLSVVFMETTLMGGDKGFVVASDTFAAGGAPAPDPVDPSVAATNAEVEDSGKTRRDRRFRSIAVSGANLSGIEDGGVMANSRDDVISYFRSNHSFIFTRMLEAGGLKDTFGSSGVREIQVKASGDASPTTIIVPNFTGMEDVPSYMAIDRNDNVLIACKVELSTAPNAGQILVFRLRADNGALDTSFGSGAGFILVNALVTPHRPEALLVDNWGNIILVAYMDDDAGDETAFVFKLSSVGVLDNTVDLSSASSITNAVPGLSAALDKDGNVYVGGQQTANSTDFSLFCVKLTSGTNIDATFNSGSGLYQSGTLSDLEDGDHTRVFMSTHQVIGSDGSESNTVQIVAQKKDAAPGVLIQELTTDGDEDTDFGANGRVAVDITGLNDLNDAERNIEGELFCGGTLTSGTKQTFLAKFTTAGALDITFGDDIIDVGDLPDGIKSGIALLPPSDGWTCDDGGFFFIDSGDHLPIAWIESSGEDRRLQVRRVVGSTDFDFDLVEEVGSAQDDRFHLLAFFNDLDRMHAYLNVNGILDLARGFWSIPGSPLSPAEVEVGVGYLDDAFRIILNGFVAAALDNAFGVPFGVKPKTGPQQDQMAALMVLVDATFSEAQMNFMDTGVQAAFSSFELALRNAYETITGKTLKTSILPPDVDPGLEV